VRRCLDAMNEAESSTLEEAQRLNETASHRNVGLVIETRPDHITPEEVRRLRWLGVTKVQLGVQSLDDAILRHNKRGHTVEATRNAMRLLRLGGFKIVVHWMPNLLGATPESDLADFRRLWDDAASLTALRPDELKIYPTALLENTELYTHWQRGEYTPYDEETLVSLLARCKPLIPPYCRVNRLMRDIPSPNIVEGVKKTNLRQIVQRRMKQEGSACCCIRCREVRGQEIDAESLRLGSLSYETDATREVFLSYVTPGDRLVGFLRLSLPQMEPTIEELTGCAVIREVHVYGPALELGDRQAGSAQHAGLGTRLIEEAKRIAREEGYERLAVIAAVGTRPYYRERGFERGELYMSCRV
jgi:elongator complex protein 3